MNWGYTGINFPLTFLKLNSYVLVPAAIDCLQIVSLKFILTAVEIIPIHAMLNISHRPIVKTMSKPRDYPTIKLYKESDTFPIRFLISIKSIHKFYKI